jgi:peptide/nickel transport system ATP-binding protein
MAQLVQVNALVKDYSVARGGQRSTLRAVDEVTFTINEGESLGLVGETGSGKSTIAKMLCCLETISSGRAHVAGYDLTGFGGNAPVAYYDSVQMIFQDPYLSLSPRMNIGDAIGYALKIRKIKPAHRRKRVDAALTRVGLPRTVATRFPHQLSTGQRQRVGIARAIIAEPRLIIADEPVSSLDVSLQTQILNLLRDIQADTGVSYLFISHDIAAVAYLCEKLVVLRNGSVVEAGLTQQLLERPDDEYSKRLVEAAALEGFGDE